MGVRDNYKIGTPSRVYSSNNETQYGRRRTSDRFFGSRTHVSVRVRKDLSYVLVSGDEFLGRSHPLFIGFHDVLECKMFY